MGLFSFFTKPKWKNSNSRVRLAAVENMSVDDLETLLEIIREDSDQQVRLAALEKITDRESVESLLRENLGDDLIAPAKTKLEEIYTNQILSETDPAIAQELLPFIKNQQILARIVTSADSVDLRCHALAAIDDPQLLCELLEQHIGKKPALLAVEKIDDPKMLAEIAEKAINKSARSIAASKLNPEIIVENDAIEPEPIVEVIQEIVVETVAVQEIETPNNDQLIAEKTEQRKTLCAELETLCKEMGETANARFADIEQQWPADNPEIDNEELLALRDHYKHICLEFHTTDSQFKNEKQDLEKIGQSCAQIEKFLKDDDIEQADALLQKCVLELENLVCRWLKKDDVAARLSSCQDKITQRNEREQAIADACVEMEQLASSSYTIHAEKKAKTLNKSWKSLTSAAGKQNDERTVRFQTASTSFWEKKEQFYKEQEWQYWNNKTRKEELCTLVESLKEDKDLHQLSSKLKEFQATWKQIGPVHKKYSDALWSRFKSSCDESFARCREFYAELDQKRDESVVVQEGLCMQAEEHIDSTQWKESGEILQRLQKEWKEAGPGERDKEQPLYKRFKHACDQFFQRRNVYYAEQDADREENLLAKEKLCQSVEDLLQDPNLEQGKIIQELQKNWKEIGPAPRKNDQQIWKRFRAACDSYYGWLDEQRLENLQQKILLCEQVETLLPEKEDAIIPTETVDKVVEIQKEWKTIGPVPRKDDDAIWKRFTSQCDTFFVARKLLILEEENKKLENQKLKENLLQKAGEIIQQEDEKVITVGLQELQKEWKTIGPVPRKHDQLLWDEFQALCNAFFQQKADRFEVKKAVLEKNLKLKEELCLQLERLTGNTSATANTTKEGGLDLIEQFKIARETNFLLAGKTENAQQKKEEVLRIQQEWKTLGPTFRDHEQRLWKRYRRAIDLFFAK